MKIEQDYEKIKSIFIIYTIFKKVLKKLISRPEKLEVCFLSVSEKSRMVFEQRIKAKN